MSEWKTARLSEIADVRVSNVDKKSLPHEPAVKLCNYMDVYSNDYITSDLAFMEATAAPSQIERFKVQVGDVMITKDSETPEDIGIPAVVTESIPDLVCGYHLALIKPDSKQVDGRYLAKQLGTSTTANYYARRAAGSTRYGLSNGTINDTPIPLVPVPQQRRIATILTTLDEEIEATEALIAKHQQIKAGLMHDLFTRGLWTQAELARGDHKGLPCEATAKQGHLRPTPDEAPRLYQDSPLGVFPREWRRTRFVDLFDFPSGQVDPTQEPYRNWVLIAPDHIERGTGRLLAKESALEQGAISGKYQFESGDIVYSKIRPYLRKAILADFHGLCSADMYPLRPVSGVNARFLLGVILGESFSRFAECVSMRSGFPKINREEMTGYHLPIPSVEEQAAIAHILESADSLLTAETTHLAKLRQQKQGLMHDLLTGRVRVDQC